MSMYTSAAAEATYQKSSHSVEDYVRENYPAYSFLLNEPEIVDVFRKALDPRTGNTTLTESSNQLLAQIQNTNYWKTHGSAVQNYIKLQRTDPDTLAEQVQAKDAEVHQLANMMGLADNQVDIEGMARKALMYGWSSAEMQEQLAGLAQPGAAHVGTIDNAIQQIKANASNYMVNIDDSTAFAWARDVAAGHHNVADYNTTFADWAKGKFPTLQAQIDQGITPKQYFAPIQQEAARLLETPADGVDLVNDPRFSKIINYTDPKTNAPRPMNLAEAQSYIRSTDMWKGTKQAQQSASDMTEGILQMFGKTASGASQSGLNGPSNAF